MNEIVVLSELLLKEENKPDYINRCITEPTKISVAQKRLTKKAILWLLSIAPHTVEEISDHFEISFELVKSLITELAEANYVIEEYGSVSRYQLNTKKKALITKNKKINISFQTVEKVMF